MNAKNLKLKASEAAPAIDWAAVDAAPLADVPDDDSPPLTTAQAAQLRPLGEELPALQLKPAKKPNQQHISPSVRAYCRNSRAFITRAGCPRRELFLKCSFT